MYHALYEIRSDVMAHFNELRHVEERNHRKNHERAIEIQKEEFSKMKETRNEEKMFLIHDFEQEHERFLRYALRFHQLMKEAERREKEG